MNPECHEPFYVANCRQRSLYCNNVIGLVGPLASLLLELQAWARVGTNAHALAFGMAAVYAAAKIWDQQTIGHERH